MRGRVRSLPAGVREARCCAALRRQAAVPTRRAFSPVVAGGRPHLRGMPDFKPLTRAAGSARMAGFGPAAGGRYATARNTDRGPGREPSTSALSPYLRRRLLTEPEVIAAAVEAHGRRGAERFIEEVVWRSYFKGHLETRPSIWTDYQRQAGEARDATEHNAGLRRAYTEAVEGRTGIEGFDDWARELVQHGWLHNHARMWFASIWIFTLRLPWALGADFFMRHLLDGDPASNTLSWRWVAGLHTRGKAYAARAENIARHTEGRFRPTGLNEAVHALTEEEAPPLVPLAPAEALPGGDVALLLHLDDLQPETLELGSARVVRVGAVVAHAEGASDQVRAADGEAMADALARAGAHSGCEAGPAEPGWEDGLPVVAAWAPVGPSANALPPCLRVRREWDERAWPRSTRGYFQLRSAIPQLLELAVAGE